MNERQTCGKGLADRSAFPAKLGELIVAMIENLEAHQETLDVRTNMVAGGSAPT